MRIDPKLISEGYINVQKHPTLNYYIYNYSHLAQIKGHWVEDTRRARGLILDEQGNIIARPFEKFFNWEEYGKDSKLGELPKYTSFQVFEKMDGSLVILYPTPNGYFFSTRGSFVSDQSKMATEILRIKYSHVKFLPQYTYLFEILYKENRIVVDYGNTHDIILLAIIDNVTVKDLSYEYVKNFADQNQITVVKKFDGITDFVALQKLNLTNQEGFVILFDHGLRIKIKFDDYKKLHRIIFALSTKSIWECLRSGERVENYFAQLPDEFYQWALKETTKLEAEYQAIEQYCAFIVGRIPDYFGWKDMKKIAEYFKTCKYQGVLFAMYHYKEYKDIIWRIIEPQHKRPFMVEGDKK